MAAIIEVVDLVKHFPGVKAVDGLSFAIPAGSCFGLLGPNGAGKTTTIELLEGILTPTAARSCFTAPRAARIIAPASASSSSTRRYRIS